MIVKIPLSWVCLKIPPHIQKVNVLICWDVYMRGTGPQVAWNLLQLVMELLVCRSDVYFSWPLTSYQFISWYVILHSGFIKFLGPYYMVLITKRRQIGAICGHTVYAVSKSEMIPLQNPSVESNIDENRSLILDVILILLL